ncbi:hypothetical protein KC460_04980 [Candidatus Dependentiae bacterium]|nr:hypothetical protein [Candidatus Dependentiae bacterium]
MLCYKKNTMLSLIFIAALAGSAQTTHAVSIELIDRHVGNIINMIADEPLLVASGIIVPFLAYCIFSYNCKVPNKNFKARYSLRFKDLKIRIRSISGLMEQFRYIIKNIYWIIEDGVVGIPGNSSNSVRVDPITKKVNVKECSSPAGLFGWIHAYSKPITETAKAPYELGKTALQIAVGIYIWQNIHNLIPTIKSVIEEIATEEGMKNAITAAGSKVLI